MVDKSGGKVLARKEESKVETVPAHRKLFATDHCKHEKWWLSKGMKEQKKEMNTQGRNALNSVRIKGKRA